MLTLGEAARQTGLSKPTISKAIRTGRLSATRNEQGEYQIDPAELFRVYQSASKPSGNTLQRETPVNAQGLPLVAEAWQAERERERRQLENTIEDLRRRLDTTEQAREKAFDEIRRLTLLLTHQTEISPSQPASWPRRERIWVTWVPAGILLAMLAYVAYTVIVKREAIMLAPAEEPPEPAKPPAVKSTPSPAPVQPDTWKPENGG